MYIGGDESSEGFRKERLHSPVCPAGLRRPRGSPRPLLLLLLPAPEHLLLPLTVPGLLPHCTVSPASRVATSSRVHQHPLSVSGSQPQSSFSQVSSQDLSEETRTLTPTSTSVLLPEMTTFLSCPHCNEQFEEEGQRSPNTLHCGHTFCLGKPHSISLSLFRIYS